MSSSNITRVALTSDTHLGLTSEPSLRKMFREMSRVGVDVLVHAGDYCGGRDGARSVRTTVRLARSVLGSSIPYISVLGNHDYWCRTGRLSPSEDMWYTNLLGIQKTCAEQDVFLLDTESEVVHAGGLQFLGHTGWYRHPNPPTNDSQHMPLLVGGVDPHTYLARQAREDITRKLELVELMSDSDRARTVWVSHMPVVAQEEDPGAHHYGGDSAVGNQLQYLGVTKYMCGHAHQTWLGTRGRLEAGSDYGKPAWLLIQIDRDTGNVVEVTRYTGGMRR